jgi:REP element-mobilizing transposase RayT
MEDYKRGGSHTVWDCKYHLVSTTKYRYKVLGGEGVILGTDVGNCYDRLHEGRRW